MSLYDSAAACAPSANDNKEINDIIIINISVVNYANGRKSRPGGQPSQGRLARRCPVRRQGAISRMAELMSIDHDRAKYAPAP